MLSPQRTTGRVLLALSLVLLGTFVSAFSVCGVDFSEPASLVLGDSNVFYVDVNGNVYIGSSEIHEGGTPPPISETRDSFVFAVGTSAVISIGTRDAYIMGNIYEHGTCMATPETNRLLFETASGDVLAFFTQYGDICAVGFVVYNGSQANCPPDEQNVCDTDLSSPTYGSYVNVDWYCDIEDANCKKNTTVVLECNLNDSDGGNYFNKGTCTDYCTSSADVQCPTFDDYCYDEKTLIEYYVDEETNSCQPKQVDCLQEGAIYCQRQGLGYCEYSRGCEDGECKVTCCQTSAECAYYGLGKCVGYPGGP